MFFARLYWHNAAMLHCSFCVCSAARAASTRSLTTRATRCATRTRHGASPHHALTFFLRVQCGLYGKDAELDYQSDAMCDAYQEWRNVWAGTLGGDESAIEAYDGKRTFYLDVCEAYYSKRSASDSPFLVPGAPPLFVDGCRDGLCAWGHRKLVLNAAMCWAVAPLPSAALRSAAALAVSPENASDFRRRHTGLCRHKHLQHDPR
jgi:hypothetical protein